MAILKENLPEPLLGSALLLSTGMKGKLPFGMGTIDLGLNSGTAKTLGVLVIGFVIFHATDDVGDQLWSWVSGTASSALNINIGNAGGDGGFVV